MTWVKICGLTREDDARLASELGADALGFVLAPSPRRANPHALAHWLPRLATPALKVGVWLDPTERELWELVESCGFTAVQLHGHETVDLCQRLNRQVPVIKRVRNAEEAARYRQAATHLLWEPLPADGNGLTDIWAGGLTLGNLPAHVARGPWGVDVARGVEQAPGIKDHARLRQFLAIAKQDLI